VLSRPPALPVHHVALRVTDVERSLAFYVGLLGLRERRRFEGKDGRLRSAWVDAGQAVLMLERELRGAGPMSGSGHVLAFAVHGLPEWASRLAAEGVPLLDRTAHTLYLGDPDGHRVGLSDFTFEE
jgi:lactoylglutathione lyase